MINLILNSSPFTEDREFNPANHYKETLLVSCSHFVYLIV